MKARTMRTSVARLLNSEPLNQNERYYVYLLRADGWPWSLETSSEYADDVLDTFMRTVRSSDVLGVWITRESGDGTTDVTIIKRSGFPINWK